MQIHTDDGENNDRRAHSGVSGCVILVVVILGMCVSVKFVIFVTMITFSVDRGGTDLRAFFWPST